MKKKFEYSGNKFTKIHVWSAGGVVVRKNNNQTEVLICERFSENIIALPKGKPNEGEDEEETAVREVREETGINAMEFALNMEKSGAGELLVTSMDKDGTQSGYDIELMKTISESVNIPVIASGGVGTLDHLVDGIKSGASAVLAASIFHYGTYSVNEAKQYLASKDIPVRI